MSRPKSPVTGSLLTAGCVMSASSCCTFPSQRSSVVAVVKAVARVDCGVVKAVVWGRCGCSGGIMDVGVVWLRVLCGCEFGCGFSYGRDVPVVGAVTLEAGLRQALGVLHPGCISCAAMCWALGNLQDSPRECPFAQRGLWAACLSSLDQLLSHWLGDPTPPYFSIPSPLLGLASLRHLIWRKVRGVWEHMSVYLCVGVTLFCGVFLWLYGVVGA